jgi:hypothetical protein
MPLVGGAGDVATDRGEPVSHHPFSRSAAVVVALVAVAALIVVSSASASVEVVTKRHVAFKHFKTIQAAVNAAKSGDWILIDKGVYPEAVKITTPNLHLRGLDRNKVIVDGRHRKSAGGLNGIEINKADGVYVENLTVRNFDRSKLSGPNGNEIWWNGGDGSGVIGMHGWYGQYLTAYDTGLLGGYGLFTSNAVNGSFKNVYASGFNDSGLYIGACRDCQALVDHALIERNADGYSGTNASGNLVVQNSIFRNNSIGVGPSSFSLDDLPPPQDGSCDAGQNTSPLPTFASTNIQRCTIFQNNVVADNNNLTVPANATTAAAPWGVGFEWPGLYGDLVQNNTISGNVNYGIFAFEAPNPFPPTAQTIYYQVSGNKFAGNKLIKNGTRKGGADIGLEGGAFGSMQSTNNCFSGNQFKTSDPANIEGTWGCQNATTPNGDGALISTVLTLIGESSMRHAKGQPAPRRQPSMPAPCRGVPKNPLCL